MVLLRGMWVALRDFASSRARCIHCTSNDAIRSGKRRRAAAVSAGEEHEALARMINKAVVETLYLS